MWKEQDNRLHGTFKFKDFAEAFAFMTEVAFAAERQGHHPNWCNAWNVVIFELTTHDKGNTVTEKDHRLAAAITEIAVKYVQ
jgi:4a-hydroxytetrahydrobiopterin dehydratase